MLIFYSCVIIIMNMVQSSHAEQYSSGEVVVLFPGRMVRVVLLMSVENVSPTAEPPITDPPRSGQPPRNGQAAIGTD